MEQTLNVTQYEPSVDTEDSKKQLILARVWPGILTNIKTVFNPLGTL